jgi:peptidoglycan/xylan/chitin deacetylase (PgdA/CDA1 family)
VVVTFDDGYADTLTCALPLLEQHDVPATVFVVAEAGPALFWWDELQRLILGGQFDSDRIGLRVRGRLHEFPTASAARWTGYRSIWRLLRDLRSDERAAVLAELAEQVVCAPDFGESHRRLTQEEVRQLAESRLVEIGAHTLSHPCLPVLSEPEQLREVSASKELLEEWTGRAIQSFSYPFGALTEATREIVRRASFTRACTTQPATAGPGDDPLALPRFPLADRDGDAFDRSLADAFAGRGSPSGAD